MSFFLKPTVSELLLAFRCVFIAFSVFRVTSLEAEPVPVTAPEAKQSFYDAEATDTGPNGIIEDWLPEGSLGGVSDVVNVDLVSG